MANKPKKYVITFSPKDARKARFNHRSFDKKSDAVKKLNQIKKTPAGKRAMLNPRIRKNPFYKD